MTILQHVAQWLRIAANYLDPPVPPPTVLIIPDPPYMDTEEYQMARALAMTWRENKTVSGEYKRHQVYAKMLDLFPDTPRATICLRIEQAVQSLP